MTDFFESLAARARGERPAVRPRLPGRFEPAPHDSIDANVAADTVDSPPAPAARPAPIASPEPIFSTRRDALETPAAPATTPAAPMARREAARSSPPTAIVDRETARAPPRPIVAFADPPPELPVARTPPRVAAPIPMTVAAEPPHRDDRPQAAADRPAPLPRAIVDPETIRVRRAVEPLAPTSALAWRASPETSAADLAPRGNARVRPPQFAPPLSESPRETTIHVSIGRVEVRAAQPAQESKPREPTKPAVQTLDEYLRARRDRR